MHAYTKAAREKGWTLAAIGRRWGITGRHMSNISRKPTRKDWDALGGLKSKTLYL